MQLVWVLLCQGLSQGCNHVTRQGCGLTGGLMRRWNLLLTSLMWLLIEFTSFRVARLGVLVPLQLFTGSLPHLLATWISAQNVLWFGCGLSLKGSCDGSLVPSVAMSGGTGRQQNLREQEEINVVLKGPWLALMRKSSCSLASCLTV